MKFILGLVFVVVIFWFVLVFELIFEIFVFREINFFQWIEYDICQVDCNLVGVLFFDKNIFQLLFEDYYFERCFEIFFGNYDNFKGKLIVCFDFVGLYLIFIFNLFFGYIIIFVQVIWGFKGNFFYLVGYKLLLFIRVVQCILGQDGIFLCKVFFNEIINVFSYVEIKYFFEGMCFNGDEVGFIFYF